MTEDKNVAIINYGLGNLRSVENTIEFLGYPFFIAESPEQLEEASHVILPGVGAFGEGMRNLNEHGWTEAIKHQALSIKKPFLGICLGMQLLASQGTEHGEYAGLDLIKGNVIPLASLPNIRIPHIGWNAVKRKQTSKMYEGFEKDEDFYFVHSFVFDVAEQNVISGTAEHGSSFAATVEQENIWGAQFHPEKSQKPGLHLLKNFLET